MTDNNGEFLAGNHYGPGKATVWKIDPIYRGTTIGELTLEQRAHSAVFSPDNHWLLARHRPEQGVHQPVHRAGRHHQTA